MRLSENSSARTLQKSAVFLLVHPRGALSQKDGNGEVVACFAYRTALHLSYNHVHKANPHIVYSRDLPLKRPNSESVRLTRLSRRFHLRTASAQARGLTDEKEYGRRLREGHDWLISLSNAPESCLVN